MTRFQVIDVQTHALMGTFSSSRAAHLRADRLDREYGAVRFVVRPVEYSNDEYERRVQALEAEGMTRSDAQGCVDAEDMMPLTERPR